MKQRTKLIVTLILVACALTLIFATSEKSAGVTLLLAIAGGWGFPPRTQKRRPAGRAGRQSSGGAQAG